MEIRERTNNELDNLKNAEVNMKFQREFETKSSFFGPYFATTLTAYLCQILFKLILPNLNIHVSFIHVLCINLPLFKIKSLNMKPYRVQISQKNMVKTVSSSLTSFSFNMLPSFSWECTLNARILIKRLEGWVNT